MRIKSLGKNKTELHLKDLTLLISYETPVSIISYGSVGKAALRTSEFFSVTTSKHINVWLRDNGFSPDNVPTMDQAWFDEFLNDNE